MISGVDGLVTVAIPTLDAGERFVSTLRAITAQRPPARIEVELLICDSGSSDATVAIAREHGARVIEIRREEFSHGGTRNLLAARARGAHVAFLTQDAVPAEETWLTQLLSGFSLAADVGLVYGPYRPRSDASLSVRRELATWFGSLSPDGAPRIDALAPQQRGVSAASFLGPLGYFTDVNGCVARSAWERFPFREVAYAEDHMLAQDMLRGGLAKVYLPGAAVEHSHEYSPAQWLRRSFDETRAVSEIYGCAPAAHWRDAARNLRGNVGADLRLARAELAPRAVPAALWGSLVHHGARTVGTVLGARNNHLAPAITTLLSMERRR
jgi:rhamnosyltransferase